MIFDNDFVFRIKLVCNIEIIDKNLITFQFLTKLSRELKSRVMKDYREMAQMKIKASGRDQNFQVWDVPYFSMQARNQMFQSKFSKISEFFSLGVCMEGLDRLFNRLYSVRLRLSDPLPGELWHR